MRTEAFSKKKSTFACFLAVAACAFLTGPPAASAEDPPILEVLPASLQVTSAAGEASFDVSNTGGGEMAWTAETEDEWLNILAGASGTDTGAVLVGYDSNPGSQRTGTITITAPDTTNSPQTVQIVQSTKGPGVIWHEPSRPLNIFAENFESVTVVFDKPVDFDSSGTGSFWLDDISIEGPEGEILPTDILFLGDDTYEISFPAQASTGIYRFALGPEIEDLEGNNMDQDQDGENGEPEEDAARFSIMVDQGERVLWESFEATYADWSVDNGVWEIGKPESGPEAAHEGRFVIGTVLSGNYPEQTDSRLSSPSVELLTIPGDERIELRFWHWFDYDGGDGNDKGYVQLSVWDGSAWGEWTTLATPVDAHEGDYDERIYNSGWSRCAVELTTWAGRQVRLAFYHVASSQDSYDGSRSGWYIDEVEIWRGVPQMPALEGFEDGWGDWHADRGVWQVGNPTSGPGSAHEGTSVAATHLSGNYPDQTDSCLVSPPFELPAISGDEQIELRFWHWFDYDGGDSNDRGRVLISVWDGTAWGDRTTLATPVDAHEGDYDERTYNSGWSRCAVELTAYGRAGRFVWRSAIALRVRTRMTIPAAAGYIDEVEIWRGVPQMPGARRLRGWLGRLARRPRRLAGGKSYERGLEARTRGRAWPPRTFPAIIPTRPTAVWSALPLSCRPYRATSKSSFASGTGSNTTGATATIEEGC